MMASVSNSQRYRIRRAAGQCTQCGAKSEKTRCARCANQLAARRTCNGGPVQAASHNPAVPRAGFVNAIGTCAALGWRQGDMLTSSKWKAPKRIGALMPSQGFVRLVDERGSSKDFERFPADVERAIEKGEAAE